ncbi:hypothetical protein SAMN05216332_10178 [Nitrosospira briensis]|nr:hypothetical protein SAMN05216332_10178 [Nitrosospira briensis]
MISLADSSASGASMDVSRSFELCSGRCYEETVKYGFAVIFIAWRYYFRALPYIVCRRFSPMI